MRCRRGEEREPAHSRGRDECRARSQGRRTLSHLAHGQIDCPILELAPVKPLPSNLCSARTLHPFSTATSTGPTLTRPARLTPIAKARACVRQTLTPGPTSASAMPAPRVVPTLRQAHASKTAIAQSATLTVATVTPFACAPSCTRQCACLRRPLLAVSSSGPIHSNSTRPLIHPPSHAPPPPTSAHCLPIALAPLQQSLPATHTLASHFPCRPALPLPSGTSYPARPTRRSPTELRSSFLTRPQHLERAAPCSERGQC